VTDRRRRKLVVGLVRDATPVTEKRCPLVLLMKVGRTEELGSDDKGAVLGVQQGGEVENLLELN
jgi:hypothetical protein